jgi:DNA-binding transcriptional regulator YiaG
MKTASPKSADVTFDPQSLVARVQEFAAHAKSRRPLPLVRITEIKIPPAVKPLPPREIRSIRTRLGVSQAAFAALLNVPQKTAVSWESGTGRCLTSWRSLRAAPLGLREILAGT